MTTKQADFVEKAQNKGILVTYDPAYQSKKRHENQSHLLKHIEQGTIDQHIKDLQQQDRGR